MRLRATVRLVDWPCQLLHVAVDGETEQRVFQFFDLDVPRPDYLAPGDVIDFEDDEVYGAAYPAAADIVKVLA